MKKKKLSFNQEIVLAQIPYGLENPVRSQEIAKRVGMSKRDVMEVISTLIIDHNIPIGGGRSEGKYGYFIIENEDERIRAITPLKNTVVNIKQRIERIEKIDVTTKVIKPNEYGG